MKYYFSTTLKGTSFEEALKKTNQALGKEGFGVLTEIDMKATLKKKLDVNFPDYTILGVCNPSFAYQALQAEDKIGTMLPCNVIIRKMKDGAIEVAAVDPIASMIGVENDTLAGIAEEVRDKLRKVVRHLE